MEALQGDSVGCGDTCRKGDLVIVDKDEHPHGDTTFEALAKLSHAVLQGQSRDGQQRVLATMGVGVGQGIPVALERV